MRTSRPDGISQENRSHPFFIVLRKYADEQKDIATKTTKNFLIYTFVTLTISMSVLAADIALRRAVPLNLGVIAASIFITIWRSRRLIAILSGTVFSEVNNMIFSNDYQYQSINNEQVLNTIVRCVEAIGRIKQFNVSTSILFWGFTVGNACCLIISLLILLL